MKPPRVIHASELAEYGYCAKSWYLRSIRGVTTRRGGARRREGERRHLRHGFGVTAARILRLAALLTLAAAALMLLVLTLFPS